MTDPIVLPSHTTALFASHNSQHWPSGHPDPGLPGKHPGSSNRSADAPLPAVDRAVAISQYANGSTVCRATALRVGVEVVDDGG